jgi:hypothetical protein
LVREGLVVEQQRLPHLKVITLFLVRQYHQVQQILQLLLVVDMVVAENMAVQVEVLAAVVE